MSNALRTTTLVFAAVVVCSLACGGIEDPNGDGLFMGDEVITPDVETGRVGGLYGKLVKVEVSPEPRWYEVSDVIPSGTPRELPSGDTCSKAVGDEVTAPKGGGTTFQGTVRELHGKLAKVQYPLSGELKWVECSDLLPPKAVPTPSAGPDPKPAPSGGGGASNARTEAITKCKRGCTKQCRGQSNVSKCTGACRRRCDG